MPTGMLFATCVLCLLTPTIMAVKATPSAVPKRTDKAVMVLNWEGVQMQKHDNTCGLAVLATLLSWLGQTVSEKELAGQTKLLVKGLSLFDFANLASLRGVRGSWVRTVPDALEALPVPMVAQIKNPNGHFVVIRQIYNNHVYVADPNAGNVLYSLAAFSQVWTRRIFVMR